MKHNKVIHNINESTYKVIYRDLELYFTSFYYMKKFERDIQSYIETERNYLEGKYYKFIVDIDFYLVLALYDKYEKRGFRVLKDGKQIKNIRIFIE